MNILVVGSGAREHALAWKLARSRRVDRVFAAPGNAGTATLGENLPIDVADFAAVVAACGANRVDLVVVGPEAPLAAGLVDHLQQQGIRAFGPTRAASAIESSKAFARDLMRSAGIPCAAGETFSSFEAARTYVRSLKEPPVVKADGLAAGKGVVVAGTREEAIAALDDMMVKGSFGEAGRRVVVEERLAGREASIFAFVDGEHILPTVPACDYKRALDGDHGPNTGGMGSYSPPEFLDERTLQRATDTVLAPAVRALARMGRPYRGVLYAGLMIDGAELKVLEFNCRLGDPETQVILPRLRSDLLDIIEASVDGTLDRQVLEWDPRPCLGVVMASGGYPGAYKTGIPISGLPDVGQDALVFHAGTRLQDGLVVTAGGRVLTVVAVGEDMGQARQRAYAGVKRIRFKDAHFRMDIGLRAMATGGAGRVQ